MLDKAKGNTLWLVRRYDQSYDEVLSFQIEKVSKEVIAKDRFTPDPDLSFITWAQNVINTSNVRQLAEEVPPFKELFKVRSVLSVRAVEAHVIGYAKQMADRLFREFKPYDMHEQLGNLWLNEGIDEALLLIFGLGTPTVYSNANARLGVGNDGTAPVATQSGLLGASTLFKAMDAGFPDETISAQSVRVESTFGDAEAQFQWLEQSLDNGSTPDKNLQRSNTNLGDKGAVTETWILRGDIGIN